MKLPALCLLLGGVMPAAAGDFRQDVLPVLTQHCNGCHSTAKQKGDLDLERFSSLAEIKKEPMIWEQVLEQVASHEMPPKDKPPLPVEQKQKLVRWVQGTLNEVALASAGDPGPVVLRRLSNMEYTYTVRDLTGVASLDPAREFPADGAAGEGFTNVGSALVMSPALLTKYLDAAKDIASHAVLLPGGIRFSEHTSARDWTDETLAKIRAIYARHTESVGEVELDVPGAKVVDEPAGRLPVARYLNALQGRADTDGLSPKYLTMLREAFASPSPSPLLEPLRRKFQARSLTAADIRAWQHVLWRFASVGHIGKENGPKAWQEAVTPLVPEQAMSVKLDGGKDVTLYLTTDDAGDGSSDDEVVWDNPRLVAPGRPDLPLSHLPALVGHLEAKRAKVIQSTEERLAAVQELAAALRSFHPPEGGSLLRATAPSVIELKIPAALAAGAEFKVTGRLAGRQEGSVQMQVHTTRRAPTGLIPGRAETAVAKGQWSENNLRTAHSIPVIARPGGGLKARLPSLGRFFPWRCVTRKSCLRMRS